MAKKKCFSIATYNQVEHLITARHKKNNSTIIHIKNHLIKGFGIEWLKTMQRLIKKINKNHNITYYVDSGYDYGLSILLIRENIKYIKLKANKIILKKIDNICKKNKVLLNPDFNIVDNTNKYFKKK